MDGNGFLPLAVPDVRDHLFYVRRETDEVRLNDLLLVENLAALQVFSSLLVATYGAAAPLQKKSIFQRRSQLMAGKLSLFRRLGTFVNLTSLVQLRGRNCLCNALADTHTQCFGVVARRNGSQGSLYY